MRQANFLASFSELLLGSGGSKESCRKYERHGRDDRQLIVEWPCRDSVSIHRRSSKIGFRQHISNAMADDTITSTTDSATFVNSNPEESSCYSLNDVPSLRDEDNIAVRRMSINTAPERNGYGITDSLTIASTPPRTTLKKRVRFTKEAPTLHYYVPIAPNTHYSCCDDTYFRQSTIELARAVESLLSLEAINDKTFDTLTGLPSANCLRSYLNHPEFQAEEVVGIEDLLAGDGVALARRRLKKAQAGKLMAEQRRQLKLGMNDPKCLARTLRKTSSISSNIARCRAAYAFAIRD